MPKDKIYLGKVKKEYNGCIAGQMIYLEKHSCDCGWYWGFGYIGNKNLHTHFNYEFLNGSLTSKEIFESTAISEKQWWILRDLFIQAYALKNCAEVYRYGGFQTTVEGVTNIIINKDLENQLNKDLEKVLNKIWEVLEDI